MNFIKFKVYLIFSKSAVLLFIKISKFKNFLIFQITEDGEEKETQVQLVPLQLCGVRIQNLLKSHGDKMLMSEFEVSFRKKKNWSLELITFF